MKLHQKHPKNLQPKEGSNIKNRKTRSKKDDQAAELEGYHDNTRYKAKPP